MSDLNKDITPVQFETLEPEALKAINFFTQGVLIPFRVEGRAYRAMLSLVEPRSRVGTRNALSNLDWYQIDYGSSRFFVGLSLANRQALATLFGFYDAIADLPGTLQQALDQLFFSCIFNADGNEPLQVKSIAGRHLNALVFEYMHFKAVCSMAHEVTVSSDLSSLCSFECLWDRCELDLLRLFTRVAPRRSMTLNVEQLQDIYVLVNFTLGQTSVLLSECVSLGLNDIVWFDRPKPNAIVVNIRDRWFAPGLVLKRRIILEENITEGHVMNQSEDAQSDVGSDQFVQNVPVTLEFKAGSLEIPVAELARLTKGYVFELELPLNRIQVLANGKTIAQGEMVDICGRTGVRITQVSGPTDLGAPSAPPSVIESAHQQGKFLEQVPTEQASVEDTAGEQVRLDTSDSIAPESESTETESAQTNSGALEPPAAAQEMTESESSEDLFEEAAV